MNKIKYYNNKENDLLFDSIHCLSLFTTDVRWRLSKPISKCSRTINTSIEGRFSGTTLTLMKTNHSLIRIILRQVNTRKCKYSKIKKLPCYRLKNLTSLTKVYNGMCCKYIWRVNTFRLLIYGILSLYCTITFNIIWN